MICQISFKNSQNTNENGDRVLYISYSFDNILSSFGTVKFRFNSINEDLSLNNSISEDVYYI
jgi:hypothetical protein